MSKHFVDVNTATPVRRTQGAQVTLINQQPVDVYFDFNKDRLNASAPGVVPDGTKIAASTGQIQLDNFPGVVWTRAVAATFIEVQP
jgi:hypothetical protein